MTEIQNGSVSTQIRLNLIGPRSPLKPLRQQLGISLTRIWLKGSIRFSTKFYMELYLLQCWLSLSKEGKKYTLLWFNIYLIRDKNTLGFLKSYIVSKIDLGYIVKQIVRTQSAEYFELWSTLKTLIHKINALFVLHILTLKYL